MVLAAAVLMLQEYHGLSCRSLPGAWEPAAFPAAFPDVLLTDDVDDVQPTDDSGFTDSRWQRAMSCRA